MASLKCSNCGYGIRYHSEPEGVEYIYISKKNWCKICSSKFNAKDKVYNDELKKYPKLFRTDTIEEDFYNEIIKVWKCCKCGTLHAFDKNGKVTNVYVRKEICINNDVSEEGIFFDDYTWDDITEKSMPNNMLKNQNPSGYVRIYKDVIEISRDGTWGECEKYKLKDIEDALE